MTVFHDFSNTLGGHILNTAHRNSDRPALWANNKTFTYEEMVHAAQSLACTMQAFSPDKENVAIYSYRSCWAYISILATLIAGKTYVPLNPRFPITRNKKIATESSTHIFCIDRRCETQASEWVSEIQTKTLILLPDHETLPEWCFKHPQHQYICSGDMPPAENWSVPEISMEDYAYLMFTSGTTGKPKGIAVSHGNVMAYLNYLHKTWPLSPEDRCSQIYDQTFDVSVHDIFTCWQSGACLYAVPEAALLCPTNFVNTHQLTCWGSVPSLLGFIKRFGKLEPNTLPSVRYSFFCGEALPTDITASWAVTCPNSRIINLFGPTEATIAITASEWNRDNPPESAIMPIGKPFSGQEIAIVNEQGNPVIPGEKGNLLLAGNQLVHGYWRNQERTARQFITKHIPGKSETRWYLTGDIVSENKHEGLLFHGRKDFQVKINGYRVELEEVAGTFRENFPCLWAVAIPWPVDKITGSASGIIVWISGNKAQRVPENQLKKFCVGSLPAYMIPSRIFWADELPLNNSGKIDINALQRMTQELLEKKSV